MSERPFLLSISLLLFSIILPAHSQNPGSRATVPFVGCKSDGQVGPRHAPSGKGRPVSVAPELAAKLAYYQAEEGLGVLGPRGWHCFGTYGSSGSTLYISPAPIAPDQLFSDRWKGFTDSTIQLSESIGDTSGRFQVARIIALVFPAHKNFVQNVIAEGLERASDFPSGPYPSDKLTYKSKDVVEYTTPPKTDGLGTQSRLVKNDDAIQGVAILSGEELSLTQLSIRLPRANQDLVPIVIQELEREATK